MAQMLYPMLIPPADVDKEVDYFEIASNFIGINTITTTTSLGTFKLPRSELFKMQLTIYKVLLKSEE
jgi:hypothetical protein